MSLDLTLDPSDPYSALPTPLDLSPAQLFSAYSTVNVLAPLVRCSKLPFRHLCSLYETHVTHTPMILAPEFSRSQAARVSDFSSSTDERGVFWMEPRGRGNAGPPSHQLQQHPEDAAEQAQVVHQWKTYHLSGPHRRLPHCPTPPTPHSQLVRGRLIAQFASPNAASLADAAELIAPYVDGLDLNCGCPQSWAYHEGIGCALLRKPELVRDMVRAVKDRMGWGWPVSIKIRVDPDLKWVPAPTTLVGEIEWELTRPRLTDQLVKTALQANISHLTIHGRTRHQASTEAVDLDAVRFAVEAARGEVPCVANGDLWTLADAQRMRDVAGVQGVMAARGILANPALFAGYDKTPRHAVQQFINLSLDYGFIYPLFHRHLAYMLESHFTKPQRTWFNALSSSTAAIDHLIARGIDISASRADPYAGLRGKSILVP